MLPIHPNQTQPVVSLPALPALSLSKGARSKCRTYFKPNLKPASQSDFNKIINYQQSIINHFPPPPRSSSTHHFLYCGYGNKAEKSQNGISRIFESMFFAAGYEYYIFLAEFIFFSLAHKYTFSFEHKHFVFVGMAVQWRKPAAFYFEHSHREIFRPIIFGNQPSYLYIFRPLYIYRLFSDITAFFDFHFSSFRLEFILLNFAGISLMQPVLLAQFFV
jgi:hypothetical protein